MGNLAHSKTETLSIVVVFAIVKTKYLLINVTREMKRLNCNIRSFKSTLQETPEVFESVRVHSAFYVLFRVIYNFVDVLLSERIIDNRIVAVHSAAIFHAAKNFVLQNLSLDIRNDICANGAGITVKNSHYVSITVKGNE